MARKPGKGKGGKKGPKKEAKKSTGKSAKKGGAKKGSAKKGSAKKGGAKKGGAKKAKKAVSLAPTPVKVGKGAPVGEVAAQFVQMFRANPGNDKAIWDALFHKKFESVEGGMRWSGRKAVEAKAADFNARNEVHSCAVEGPFVGTTGFGVKFVAEMSDRTSGNRTQMSELAFYTVRNGKVVEEQFLYGQPG